MKCRLGNKKINFKTLCCDEVRKTAGIENDYCVVNVGQHFFLSTSRKNLRSAKGWIVEKSRDRVSCDVIHEKSQMRHVERNNRFPLDYTWKTRRLVKIRSPRRGRLTSVGFNFDRDSPPLSVSPPPSPPPRLPSTRNSSRKQNTSFQLHFTRAFPRFVAKKPQRDRLTPILSSRLVKRKRRLPK